MRRWRLGRAGPWARGGDRGRGGRVRALGPAARRPARGQGMTVSVAAARPRGHADRQPRRPVAPGRRGAGRGRRRRLRGHPPHRPPARSTPASTRARRSLVVHDHTEAAPVGDGARHLRRGRAGGGRHRRRACPASPTPASAWCGPRSTRAIAVEVVPGPVGRDRRPRGQRPADRPVRVRGLPAPQGVGPHRAARGAGRPSGARSCSTRRPTAWPARSPTWPPAWVATAGSPLARELTKLHEEVWRGTLGGGGRARGRRSSPGASTCSCSTGAAPPRAGRGRRLTAAAVDAGWRPASPPGTPWPRWPRPSGCPERRVYDLAIRR